MNLWMTRYGISHCMDQDRVVHDDVHWIVYYDVAVRHVDRGVHVGDLCDDARHVNASSRVRQNSTISYVYRIG